MVYNVHYYNFNFSVLIECLYAMKRRGNPVIVTSRTSIFASNDRKTGHTNRFIAGPFKYHVTLGQTRLPCVT